MKRSEWNKLLKQYAAADGKKAVWQLVNTVIPYLTLFGASVAGFHYGWPFTINMVLAILSGFFMVRTFILFHDCTHGSFFKQEKYNRLVGHVLGGLTFTSFATWKKEHGIHHGAVGNLDKRGTGDIWTLTVEEYKETKWIIRLVYRIYRNPVFLFGVAPFFLFMIIQRIPKKGSTENERQSLLFTNMVMGALVAGFSLVFSIKAWLIAQIVSMVVAGGVGVWLFYVQHQFEDVYWENEQDHNPIEAALRGSTYYRLPAIMEWMSGYIGYHHVHHLNSKIPNYHLKECYREIPELKEVKIVGIWDSLPLAMLQVYDEKKRKLVSIKSII